jgi:hypothetical protein
MIWPTPYPMTTTLAMGRDGSTLSLPVVPAAERPKPEYLPIVESRDRLPGFEPLDLGTPSGYGEISSVDRNPRTGAAKVIATSSSASRFPWGEEHNTESITHEADDDEPEKTSVRGEYATEVRLSDRTLRWESSVVFRSDRTSFYYSAVRRLFENGRLLRERTWKDTIPRDFQ